METLLNLFGRGGPVRATENFRNQGNGINQAADLGDIVAGDAANAT
jgi:hypothetical protein